MFKIVYINTNYLLKQVEIKYYRLNVYYAPTHDDIQLQATEGLNIGAVHKHSNNQWFSSL